MFFLLLLASCHPHWWPRVTMSYDEKQKLYGYYDLDSSKWHIAPQFRKAEAFNLKGNALVLKGNAWGTIDRDGHFLTAPVFTNRIDAPGKRVLFKDSLWGILSEDGLSWTSLGVSEIGKFQNDMALVKKNKKLGLMNRQFELLLPPVFDAITIDDYSSFPLTVRKNDSCGIAQKDGTVRYYPGYRNIEQTRNPDVLLVSKGNGYGMMRTDGQLLLPLEYTWISDFTGKNGVAKACKGKKIGLVNTRGEWILPAEYDKIGIADADDDERGNFFCKDGKYRFYNPDGTEQAAVYDSLCALRWDCWEDCFAAKRNGKWEWLYADGSVFIPGSWTSISAEPDFDCRRLLVKLDGTLQYYNRKGRVLPLPRNADEFKGPAPLNWIPHGQY